MAKKNSSKLFNSVAPVYVLFYNLQKRRFAEVIEDVSNDLDLSSFDSIIDVGCGTGALCSVLNRKGLLVTGIDPAGKMLEVARSKQVNKDISFIQANVLKGLPFEDNSFDIAIAS